MKQIITLSFALTVGLFNAQCPTAEVIHKDFIKNSTKETNRYYVSTQSRSGSIVSDETYEMSFIAQPGFDYRLTTKAQGSTASVNYEVYELSVEKKVVNGKESYKREKKVLASSDNAGGKSLEFSTDKSRKIFVAVTLTGGDKKKPTCVGVLIEDRKSTKLGL